MGGEGKAGRCVGREGSVCEGGELAAVIELTANLWDMEGNWLVITTNGDVNRRGEAVMGRGVAAQAKFKFPHLAWMLAEGMKQEGNHVMAWQPFHIITFPVKHHWHEQADLDLIGRSCEELVNQVTMTPLEPPIFMVRPGCGNGGLDWAEVKYVCDGWLDDRFFVVERP